MRRGYHIGLVAVAVGRDEKWVDNMVTHHGVIGVEPGGRGRSRLITIDGVIQLSIAEQLHRELGLGLSAASRAGRRVAEGGLPVSLGQDIELAIDYAGIRRRVESSLADALEIVIPRRRGRPPKSKRGAL